MFQNLGSHFSWCCDLEFSGSRAILNCCEDEVAHWKAKCNHFSAKLKNNSFGHFFFMKTPKMRSQRNLGFGIAFSARKCSELQWEVAVSPSIWYMSKYVLKTWYPAIFIEIHGGEPYLHPSPLWTPNGFLCPVTLTRAEIWQILSILEPEN